MTLPQIRMRNASKSVRLTAAGSTIAPDLLWHLRICHLCHFAKCCRSERTLPLISGVTCHRQHNRSALTVRSLPLNLPKVSLSDVALGSTDPDVDDAQCLRG